ncbi:hypothetical protein ACTMS0_04600 [Micromonospora sp. H33]|uniref:hypothetical protein n=1 Tax=Micromonospora sp. H33 TaxID=3452215 RepID=UPI003F8BE172
MPEQTLDEMFAEFEAQAAPTFRPRGLAAAQRRVRDRRRRRRGLLAGITALLVGGPAGALAVAGRDAAPVPPTPPAPTVTAGPSLTERKVAAAGAVGGLRRLRFVDARHGWALFDTCDRPDQVTEGCRRTLARTTDGGVTWQGRELPPAKSGSQLYVSDERTAIVMSGDGYVTTSDGGATVTSSPMSAPSPVAQRAWATASGYRLDCPSPNGSCDGFRIARIGGGKVGQPPLTVGSGDDAGSVQLLEGGDGRIWVAVVEAERATAAVSADETASWQRLPAVEGADRLLISPDGTEVWLVETEAPKPVWKLVGDRWERQSGLPDDTYEVAAAGGGQLVVTGTYGGAGVWRGGRYDDLPELRDALAVETGFTNPATVEVARDGTITFIQGNTWILGSLKTRTWTRLS